MRQTEKDEVTHHRTDDWSTKIKIAELVYESADDVDGWKFDGGASTIPNSDVRSWEILALLPYYAGPTLGSRGLQVGWLPTLHTPVKVPVLSWSLLAEAPFGLSRTPRLQTDARVGGADAFVTPGLGFGIPNAFLNHLGVGCRIETRLKTCSSGSGIWPEYSATLFARMVRVNAYRIPPRFALGARNGWVGGVSLTDVNGLVYWMLR
jgi:hypothetical protein